MELKLLSFRKEMRLARGPKRYIHSGKLENYRSQFIIQFEYR